MVSVSQIRRHFEHKTYESDDRDSSVCYQITFDFSICFAVWLGRYGLVESDKGMRDRVDANPSFFVG